MKLAIIGGTGAFGLFPSERGVAVTTPFGPPSDRPRRVAVGGGQIVFLARHGDPHRIPPHRVNYRANIQALKSLGVEAVLALNAVGGISADLDAGTLVVPDQILDYTWGRAHTFSDGGSSPLRHIDFTHPYAGPLRAALLEAGKAAGVDVVDGGCHGIVQGPRLETAAEVRKLTADGCDLVGMTGMPEAALAREAGLDYASLCLVANAAAGLEHGPITEEDIHDVLAGMLPRIRALVEHLPVTD